MVGRKAELLVYDALYLAVERISFVDMITAVLCRTSDLILYCKHTWATPPPLQIGLNHREFFEESSLSLTTEKRVVKIQNSFFVPVYNLIM